METRTSSFLLSFRRELESASTEQEIYLKQQMEALNSAIYAKDKTDASALEAILDLDAAAGV